MAAELKRQQVVYLYGLTKTAPRDLEPTGVDRKGQVQAVPIDGVVAWISRVPAEEYEDNLARNMENLDWLASASVAHQRAVETIAKHADILPARFGTVFRTDDSLRHHLAERLEDIEKDFKRVVGTDEWGVKVFVAPRETAKMENVRSGKDYLLAKASLLPQNRTRRQDDAEFAEFQKALEVLAEDAAPSGKVSGGQRGVAFQVSLLVKRANRKKLESVLKKFSQRWANTYRIECTGPWPPYSFVSRGGETVTAQ